MNPTPFPPFTLPAELCEAVTLLEPKAEAEYEDGELIIGEEIPALAIMRECTERDAAEFGNIRDARIIVLAGSRVPTLATRIRCREHEYVLKSVRPCRDLAGRVVAVRCLVV